MGIDIALKPTWEKSCRNGKLKVDLSHIYDGVIFAAVTTVMPKGLKLQIRGNTRVGNETRSHIYYYDLDRLGTPECFPLQMGNGKYTATLHECVDTVRKRYKKIGSVAFILNSKDSKAPFKHNNQWIPYYPEILHDISKSSWILPDQKQIENYLRYSFMYDWVKAVKVKNGALPDIYDCYKKKMGICQDLAALCVSCLRMCGIPAKLVIGRIKKNGKKMHAWVVTWDENGNEVIFDPTVEIDGSTVNVDEYREVRCY